MSRYQAYIFHSYLQVIDDIKSVIEETLVIEVEVDGLVLGVYILICWPAAAVSVRVLKPGECHQIQEYSPRPRHPSLSPGSVVVEQPGEDILRVEGGLDQHTCGAHGLVGANLKGPGSQHRAQTEHKDRKLCRQHPDTL